MIPEVALAILVPLAGALSSLLAGRAAARWIAGLTVLATVCAAASVAWAVAGRGTLRHHVGGWGPALGIDLRADGLAVVMLCTIAVVAALTSAAAIQDREALSLGAGRFFSLWFFTWAGLNALVLSADIFNLYVTLELTTLGAVGLIAFAADRGAVAAALRYLLVALPGSLVYLLGVAVLYGVHGTLDGASLGARLTASPATWVAVSLMTLGLCLKSALFPLHGWLPPAYSSAQPVVAALLSSLIGKSSFYVLLRIWLEVFPAELELVAGQLLGVLGAVGLLWGSLLALRQRRLTLLLAYSSIAQIGYLFLLFPLGTAGACSGAVYLAISHAAAKASMFLAVGVIVRVNGDDDIAGLDGLARRLPLTFFTLGLASVSLIGMPPSGGFIGKWLLVHAALELGQWWIAVVVLSGGLLAAGYAFRTLRAAFRPGAAGSEVHGIGIGEKLPALALALIALVLGVAPSVPLALVTSGVRP